MSEAASYLNQVVQELHLLDAEKSLLQQLNNRFFNHKALVNFNR